MNIYTKLFKIQEVVAGIGKDSENPFFKSKYFDINKLLQTVKPELHKQNLVLLQPLSNVNGQPSIKTEIIDAETGEMITSETMLTVNPDPQKMGSAITYFRRYALQSLLALEAKDDDANDASGKNDKVVPYLPPLETLQKGIAKAYQMLGYDEAKQKEMNELFLGDEPIAEDHELLLKELRKIYKRNKK